MSRKVKEWKQIEEPAKRLPYDNLFVVEERCIPGSWGCNWCKDWITRGTYPTEGLAAVAVGKFEEEYLSDNYEYRIRYRG